MAKQALDWTTISTTPAKLGGKMGAAYLKVMAARETMKTARDAFEAIVTAELAKRKAIPAGMVPVYGYNFGKLSVAYKSAAEVKSGNGATKAGAALFD